MGIVQEVRSAMSDLTVGDRVVVSFDIACGKYPMCSLDLQPQCETTQVREKGMGARIFGYSELYGPVPGGQAEYFRGPFADYGPVKVGQDPPDVRYRYLSDIAPTAWHGVQYADVPDGGTLAVFGLGPVGPFAARAGVHLGYRATVIEPVPERRAMAGRHGVETLDCNGGIRDQLREMTGGRGPDSVLDAVGMEAHGSPPGAFAQHAAGLLPDPLARKAIEAAGQVHQGRAEALTARPLASSGAAGLAEALKGSFQ